MRVSRAQYRHTRRDGTRCGCFVVASTEGPELIACFRSFRASPQARRAGEHRPLVPQAPLARVARAGRDAGVHRAREGPPAGAQQGRGAKPPQPALFCRPPMLSQAAFRRVAAGSDHTCRPSSRPVSVSVSACPQGFPDSFVFFGAIESQYHQVANAVSPQLAKAIARELLTTLLGEHRRRRGEEEEGEEQGEEMGRRDEPWRGEVRFSSSLRNFAEFMDGFDEGSLPRAERFEPPQAPPRRELVPLTYGEVLAVYNTQARWALAAAAPCLLSACLCFACVCVPGEMCSDWSRAVVVRSPRPPSFPFLFQFRQGPSTRFRHKTPFEVLEVRHHNISAPAALSLRRCKISRVTLRHVPPRLASRNRRRRTSGRSRRLWGSDSSAIALIRFQLLSPCPSGSPHVHFGSAAPRHPRAASRPLLRSQKRRENPPEAPLRPRDRRHWHRRKRAPAARRDAPRGGPGGVRAVHGLRHAGLDQLQRGVPQPVPVDSVPGARGKAGLLCVLLVGSSVVVGS